MLTQHIKTGVEPDSSHYARIPLVFAAALVNYCVEFKGDAVFFETGNVSLTVTRDTPYSPGLSLIPGQHIIGPFERLFITTARAGKASLVVVKNYSYPFDLLKRHTVRSDSWFFDSLVGRNNYQGGGYIAAVASQYGIQSIWNPATSGKVGIFYRIGGSIATAGNRVAFAEITAEDSGLGGGGGGVNKYRSTDVALAPASAFTGRKGTLVSLGSYSTLVEIAGAAYGWVELIKDPFILLPGNGFRVMCTTVNIVLSSALEWIEVDA